MLDFTTNLAIQTLEIYKSLIPDMNAFLASQVAPQDVAALRTVYSL